MYQEIEPDNNVKTYHLKQAHNAQVKQYLAHNVQKSTQDFQCLNDTVSSLLLAQAGIQFTSRGARSVRMILEAYCTLIIISDHQLKLFM